MGFIVYDERYECSAFVITPAQSNRDAGCSFLSWVAITDFELHMRFWVNREDEHVVDQGLSMPHIES